MRVQNNLRAMMDEGLGNFGITARPDRTRPVVILQRDDKPLTQRVRLNLTADSEACDLVNLVPPRVMIRRAARCATRRS